MRLVLPAVFAVTFAVPASAQDKADDLLRAAREALSNRQPEEALKLAGRAAALAPKNAAAPYYAGAAHGALGKNAEAVAAYAKALALDGKLAAAYQSRGGAHFKLGKIKESLEDFDKFLELRPEKKEDHWQRGISLYYAGRYEEGKDQFKLGDKVFANDVENAFWHYLCNARATNLDKARSELLKIGNDGRVPLMVVYALIQGKAKAEDVLVAAAAGSPPKDKLNAQLFYGHLYLGLYYEAAGDKRKAYDHLAKAADDYRIGHYMGDVARVHRDILKKELKK